MDYDRIATYSQVVSAILFLCVMVWLWFKYAQPAVLAAQESSNRAIAESERHRDEAKTAVSLLQHEIEGARRDADAIRERAAHQAQRESQRTLAEARESGERTVRNAQGELERARAAARERLRDEFLERALQRAREDARRRMDDGTNERLVRRFVASVESGHDGRG